MNYEIVTLEEKIVAGIAARTNNMSPDMGQVIGGLWDRFFNENVYEGIPHKVNKKALGIYTDYAADDKGDYTIMTACEISEAPKGMKDFTVRKIPAGEYAKFVIKGDMEEAVSNCWQAIWEMDLPRTFLYDFEEYQNDDMEEAEIHIYVGLKTE